MRLLLRRLSEFVEDTVVEIAVVIQFICFVNFFYADTELDDHVFVHDKLLDRL